MERTKLAEKPSWKVTLTAVGAVALGLRMHRPLVVAGGLLLGGFEIGRAVHHLVTPLSINQERLQESTVVPDPLPPQFLTPTTKGTWPHPPTELVFPLAGIDKHLLHTEAEELRQNAAQGSILVEEAAAFLRAEGSQNQG